MELLLEMNKTMSGSDQLNQFVLSRERKVDRLDDVAKESCSYYN